MGLRGMVVSDEYNAPHSVSFRHSSNVHSHHNSHQARAQQHGPAHQQRHSFSAYNPTIDYSAYFGSPQNAEYTYRYDAFQGNADPGMYNSALQNTSSPQAASIYPSLGGQTIPHHVAEMRGQPGGIYYEYAAASRAPGSQYYFPTPQAMVYQPLTPQSPMQLPQIPHGPATLGDKKRELQVWESF